MGIVQGKPQVSDYAAEEKAKAKQRYADKNSKFVNSYKRETNQNDSKPVRRKPMNKGEFIQKNFHPSVVKWLKDNLDIDLKSLDLRTIYDIRVGNMTKPLAVTIKPLGHDFATGKTIEGQPLDAVCSFMFKFPYKKERGKYVMTDIGDQKPYVASFPIYPKVEVASSKEMADEAKKVQNESVPSREPIVFSNDEYTALSCIGLDKSVFYTDNNSALSYETKQAIKNGEPFEMKGRVVTSFGAVNTFGTGRMVRAADGSLKVAFESTYPVKKSKDEILDITSVCHCGNVDIDVFDRKAFGKGVKTDIYGIRRLNEAARQLIEYGYALEPMVGYEHKYSYKKSENKMEDAVSRNLYQVSVVNGGLFIKKMEKDQVPDLRLNDDNTVTFGVGSDKQVLEFEDQSQLDSYIAGKGGFVKEAKWVTYADKDGERVKDGVQTYRAFVLADNQKCGFAKLFSPAASAKIAESREKGQTQTAKRKQNFSFGI